LSPEETPTDAVLSVRDLSVSFATRQGVVRAVDGLSFDVGTKEVLGIVGESGSGKSVAMYSMLGLVRDANVSISGSVRFEGREILGLSDTEMQSVRGGEVGMIFQDPMTALTPVYTVGWQIVEQLRAHNDMTKKAAYVRATELLAEVGIPDPRAVSITTLTNSLAACASASSSPWPSRAIRNCLSLMSRRRHWTSRPRPRSWT